MLVPAIVRQQARYSVEQGESSVRANPRAAPGYPLRLRNVSGEWPAPRYLNTLDHAVAYLRPMAGTLHQISEREDAGELRPSVAFRHDHAALLAGVIEILPRVSGPATA